jgi:citrate synthase
MAWITRVEALKRLKVKPQSLYAYVSRGLVAAKAAEGDSRQSLYAEADIAALVQRRRAGRKRDAIAARAIAWGDPVMDTAITTVRDGRLIYAGQDALALAARSSLEDAARLLWAAPDVRFPPAPLTSGASAKARALSFLAYAAAHDAPSFGRARPALADEAARLFSGFAAALTKVREGPAHMRLAKLWRLNSRQSGVLRRALVLVADHELNPSTFAARVAAGTGASLAACALAGCATLTGPLHGEAAARALEYLQEAMGSSPKAALQNLLVRGRTIPGVGHALYPSGDPRAAALLAALKPPAKLKAAIAAAEDAAGEAANIDMALAALTLAFGAPDDAPFVIFALGRMVGWMAHAIEQRERGQTIRPRAHYVGKELKT